jgi:hypothetical protein
MAETDVRVEIGFEGGLILSLKLAQVEWAKLETALESGEGGKVALAGEDTTTHVVLSRICYVKHESHVGRIGF